MHYIKDLYTVDCHYFVHSIISSQKAYDMLKWVGSLIHCILMVMHFNL